MSMTPEREALLRMRLVVLEEAEFKLVGGASVATVSYEGESVTYRQVTGGLHQIRDLMNRIRRELGEPLARQTVSKGFVVR